MNIRSIEKTVYPIDYNKNASKTRDKNFTKAFNKWAMYIRFSNLEISHQSAINHAFKELMK